MEKQSISYAAQIIKFLGKIGTVNGTVNPDKSNTGNFIGEAFLWDTIRKYAEGMSKGVWKELTDRGIIEEKRSLLPGDHVLISSGHFTITAKVSAPVRRFNPDALADILFKRHKIPKHTALEMIEQAKVPTTSTVTMTIIEK